MKVLYFIRHGKTTWIQEELLSSVVLDDIPLSKEGQNEACRIGEYIIQQGIIIDKILYSPIRRVEETAFLISSKTGIPIQKECRLRKQNWGKWDSEIPRDEALFLKAKSCLADSYDGGESMFKIAQRVYNLIDEIKFDSSNDIYLLIGHDSVARVVNSYFYDMTNEEFAGYHVPNCKLIEYKFV